MPYAVETALSGVMEHHDHLWYRRAFSVPAAWTGQRLMLHFDAVDYEAEVLVNGKSLGVHRGGYEPFAYDVAPFVKGTGLQELVVRVFDPTEAGGQPLGECAGERMRPASASISPLARRTGSGRALRSRASAYRGRRSSPRDAL